MDNTMSAAELLLPLDEWNALEKPQDPHFQEWLAAWGKVEPAEISSDEFRQRMRYGHYLGWIAARRTSR
jgi:hypothetical protein